MPNGEIHLRMWRTYFPLAAASAALVLVVFQDLGLALGVLGGYLLGRYIDPDLDQVGITSAEGRLMRELKIVGVLVTAWFVPYGYAMKHRSFLSHFPGVSTAIRLGWLLVLPLLAVWYFQPSLPVWAVPVLAAVFAGLTLADTVHYLLDTQSKKRRKLWKTLLR
jgi:uncharacterized metal-binding protein